MRQYACEFKQDSDGRAFDHQSVLQRRTSMSAAFFAGYQALRPAVNLSDGFTKFLSF